MPRRFPHALALLGSLAAPTAAAAEPPALVYEVVLEPARVRRVDVELELDLPPGVPRDRPRLRDGRGRDVPCLVDGRGKLRAFLDEPPSGASTTWQLDARPADEARPEGSVWTSRQEDGDVVALEHGGRTLFRYQGGEGTLPRPDMPPAFRRGGYVAALSTPAGVLVTDDYPDNHKHHHGLWFTFSKVLFDGRHPDFWNMGDRTGTVLAVGREAPWAWGRYAAISARHRHVDLLAPTPTTVLDERWDLVLRAPPRGARFWVLDVTSIVTTAGPREVVLESHLYGGLGLRGHARWNGKDAVRFLTSEGKGRPEAHATRPRWASMFGDVDGKPAGFTVIGHPENLRDPQPVRVHSEEPFLAFAPMQLGPVVLDTRTPLVSRYRVVIHDGAPDPKTLARLTDAYLHPPRATVRPLSTPRRPR